MVFIWRHKCAPTGCRQRAARELLASAISANNVNLRVLRILWMLKAIDTGVGIQQSQQAHSQINYIHSTKASY